MNEVVAIANDHAGVALKQTLLNVVRERGFTVVDLGVHTDAPADYPDYGKLIGQTVSAGDATFGIAICGSGIGISIAANRVPGARAALCFTPEIAKLARQHNDANILALGARLINKDDAAKVVDAFLTTAFEGGRHADRVAKLG